MEEETNKRPRGDVRPQHEIEARIRRLYRRQLEGLTARQLVLDHAAKEQIGQRTAWRDWEAVQKLNKEDFSLERDAMAGRIFSMRQRLFHTSMKRGQMNTAAQVLDSLARMAVINPRRVVHYPKSRLGSRDQSNNVCLKPWI